MKLSDILKKGIKSYKKNVFPEEQKKHHQGGIKGYSLREIIADLNSEYKAKINNVFAWNPSISGTKIKDTYILGEERLECIRQRGSWAYKKTTGKPKILTKNNYFYRQLQNG